MFYFFLSKLVQSETRKASIAEVKKGFKAAKSIFSNVFTDRKEVDCLPSYFFDSVGTGRSFCKKKGRLLVSTV